MVTQYRGEIFYKKAIKREIDLYRSRNFYIIEDKLVNSSWLLYIDWYKVNSNQIVIKLSLIVVPKITTKNITKKYTEKERRESNNILQKMSVKHK